MAARLARSSVVDGQSLNWVKSRRDLMEGTRASGEAAVHSRRDLTQPASAHNGLVAVKAQGALTLETTRAVAVSPALAAGFTPARDAFFFRVTRREAGNVGSLTSMGDWKIYPSMDVAYIPQTGDKKVKVKADGADIESIINGKHSLSYKAGLDAVNGNWGVSVHYAGATGTDGLKSHSINGRISYRF